jgi:phage gp45-like
MVLPTRNVDIEAIATEAAIKAYRLVIKQLADDGTVQAEGLDGQILQQEDVERVTPYGFDSNPPADSEGVSVPGDAADVIVGERRNIPSGLPACAQGSSRTYSESGSYLQHNKDGDSEYEPNSGKVLKLGKTATKALALHQDINHKLAAMATWMTQVETELNILTPGTVFPLSSTFTAISSINASATKAKGE